MKVVSVSTSLLSFTPSLIKGKTTAFSNLLPSKEHTSVQFSNQLFCQSMEKSCPRREFLSSFCGPSMKGIFLSLPKTIHDNQVYFNQAEFQNQAPLLTLTNVQTISQFIKKSCNAKFLSNVRQSGYNFLYRGLPSHKNNAHGNNSSYPAFLILDEPYDLLDPRTYRSKEAVSYFQSLEEQMLGKGMSIKPSNAHIGTTCPKKAAVWGEVFSIWPIGETGVEFAWLKDGGEFWPLSTVIPTQRIVTDSGISRLSDALKGDAWEVMFRADDGFLAVSSELDEELRTLLKVGSRHSKLNTMEGKYELILH